MIRTFKYPLLPTKAQAETLTRWLAACCSLYNAALQERRDAWRKQRTNISYFVQQKELTGLRAAMPEWAEIPVWVERSALRRIDRSFSAFFGRMNRGESPGHPRFRSLDRYNSFDLGSSLPRTDNGGVFLPKLGRVRFKKYRELRGQVREVAVRRHAGRWCVCFVCDLGAAPPKVPPCTSVGVDLGLDVFATLSTGERIENPRFLRVAEEEIARRQRVFARKKKGSNSRRRAKRVLSRIHERVANQRSDFVRKLACALFARFDLIAYEDLQIARMIRGHLGKSITDAGWGQFLRAVACKAESAGKWAVPVDPRGTSQRCTRCDAVVKKSIDDREHSCPSCGFVTHRDHNAALNIVALGLSVGQSTEASEVCHGR